MIKGSKMSEESRIKMSESRKSSKHHLFGLHHSIESKQKMSRSHMGINTWSKGKKFTIEYRKKISENHADVSGENNPNWKGGIETENHKIRKSLEYKLWRTAIFERDKYTCIWCGNNKSGNLNADHIKPFSLFPELRFDIDNGRTLCIPCHATTGSYLNKKIIKENYL